MSNPKANPREVAGVGGTLLQFLHQEALSNILGLWEKRDPLFLGRLQLHCVVLLTEIPKKWSGTSERGQ